MALTKAETDGFIRATGDAIRKYVAREMLTARVEIAAETLAAVNLVRAEFGLPLQKALGVRPKVRVPCRSAPYP